MENITNTIKMEEENFDVDWLNERYPFDVEARDKSLENKVLGSILELNKATLIDVGAGTGSNCLYFMDQLPNNQNWFLVEQKKELNNATIRRFKDYANYHKYEFEKKKNILKIDSLQKQVTVTLINGSLLNLPDLLDLKTVDLITANAVFDLFSDAQINQFTSLLEEYQTSLYATLNYEKMQFVPEDPFDEIFINEYNSHMERPQAFGQALGRKAAAYMIQQLEAGNGQLSTATSSWQIRQDDIKMHYYLLNFMENALGEMDLAPAMLSNFERWVARKKELIITRQQQLEIQHLDIFWQV